MIHGQQLLPVGNTERCALFEWRWLEPALQPFHELVLVICKIHLASRCGDEG